MKLRVAWIAALLALPAVTAAQSVDDVLAKVFAARGGVDKIRAVQSQRVSGRISFGNDASGPFVVELKRPLRMHMVLTVQGMTMVRVYDGKSAGWSNNPFAGKPDPEAMDEEELRNISEESDFDGPLLDYKDKGNRVELAGKDKVNGKDVWRVKLTNKSGDVRGYLFDAGTFLLLEWEGKRKAQGQEFPIQSYFSDYRDVDGLKFAFEIESGSSANDIGQKITIEKIELNPQISDSEFSKPAAPGNPQPAAPSAEAKP